MKPALYISNFLGFRYAKFCNHYQLDTLELSTANTLPQYFKACSKVVTKQVSIATIGVTAFVETTACIALVAVNSFLLPASEKPLQSFVHNCSYISFDELRRCNLFQGPFRNIFVVAELFLEIIAGAAAGISYLQETHFMQQPAYLGNVQIDNKTTETIEAGVRFFKERILAQGMLSENTRQLVLENDSEVYVLVLSKAVYEYLFGVKQKEGVPQFFKHEARQAILTLRSKYLPHSEARFKEVLFDLEEFEKAAEAEGTKNLLNELRQIAYIELQGGFFATDCWQRACIEIG
jgi:hypothetical protein